jgi:hypothetical protein
MPASDVGAEPTARHPPRSGRALAAPLPAAHRMPTLYIVHTQTLRTQAPCSRSGRRLGSSARWATLQLVSRAGVTAGPGSYRSRWRVSGYHADGHAGVSRRPVGCFVSLLFALGTAGARLCQRRGAAGCTAGVAACKGILPRWGRPCMVLNAASPTQGWGNCVSCPPRAAELFARHGNHQSEWYSTRRPKLRSRPAFLPDHCDSVQLLYNTASDAPHRVSFTRHTRTSHSAVVRIMACRAWRAACMCVTRAASSGSVWPGKAAGSSS